MAVSSCCHCQHSPGKRGTSGAHSREEGVHGWLSFAFRHTNCLLRPQLRFGCCPLAPNVNARKICHSRVDSTFLSCLALLPTLASLSFLSGQTQRTPSDVPLSIIDAPSSLHTRIYTPDSEFRFWQLLTCKPHSALLLIYSGRRSPPLPG